MEMSPALKTKLNEHVGMHVEGGYPATCSALVESCNNMNEFTTEEKDWFAKALPHGTFNSPDEVKKAISI
jgi:hypothetical protein